MVQAEMYIRGSIKTCLLPLIGCNFDKLISWASGPSHPEKWEVSIHLPISVMCKRECYMKGKNTLTHAHIFLSLYWERIKLAKYCKKKLEAFTKIFRDISFSGNRSTQSRLHISFLWRRLCSRCEGRWHETPNNSHALKETSGLPLGRPSLREVDFSFFMER